MGLHEVGCKGLSTPSPPATKETSQSISYTLDSTVNLANKSITVKLGFDVQPGVLDGRFSSFPDWLVSPGGALWEPTAQVFEYWKMIGRPL